MVEQDPAYVVRRFESGKYAVDSEVRSIYLEVTILSTYSMLHFSIFALTSGGGYVEWGKQNDVCSIHAYCSYMAGEVLENLLSFAQFFASQHFLTNLIF